MHTGRVAGTERKTVKRREDQTMNAMPYLTIDTALCHKCEKLFGEDAQNVLCMLEQTPPEQRDVFFAQAVMQLSWSAKGKAHDH
jgi:DNA-directed RNA polymerase specialized sigma24 family protein